MPLYRHVNADARLGQFKCVEFVEELMYGHLRKTPLPVARPTGGPTMRSLTPHARRRGSLALAAGLWLTPAAAQAPGRQRQAAGRCRARADGQPDLQGNWTNATVTPLERPPGQPAALTADVVAKIEKGVQDRIERLAAPSDPNRPAPPQGGDGSTGAAGNVGGYNNFWIDAGERVAIINGEYRTSLIVDPPDGRVPALTDEAPGPPGRAR